MSLVPWPGFGHSVPRKTETIFDSTITLLKNGTEITSFIEKYVPGRHIIFVIVPYYL